MHSYSRARSTPRSLLVFPNHLQTLVDWTGPDVCLYMPDWRSALASSGQTSEAGPRCHSISQATHLQVGLFLKVSRRVSSCR